MRYRTTNQVPAVAAVLARRLRALVDVGLAVLPRVAWLAGAGVVILRVPAQTPVPAWVLQSI